MTAFQCPHCKGWFYGIMGGPCRRCLEKQDPELARLDALLIEERGDDESKEAE